MKTILKKCLTLCAICGTVSLYGQTPADDKNWDTTVPFFFDDFNGTALNTSVWRTGWGYDDYVQCSLPLKTITFSGQTVTITTKSDFNSLQTGNQINMSGITGFTSNPPLNGHVFTITAISNNSFTIPVTSITGVMVDTGCINWDNTFNFPANVYLDGNSHLILQSDYDATRPNNKVIHSGAITSLSTTYAYGYYEIRCKLNSYGTRYMPAFWLYGGSPGGTPCANQWYNENDIIEAFQETASTDYNLSTNLHYKTNCDPHENGGTECFHNNYMPGVDLSNTFHTYGYEWSPQREILYLDGVPYRTINSPYVADHGLAMSVDLGLRTPWVNAPTGGLGTNGPDYKNYMTVDYIKIYNLKRNCTAQTISNFNSSTFTDYSLRQFITINGTSAVSAGHKVTFRAQDGILINGDFTVPTGSELNLLPTICY
jgi:beta-glucanase (GH16 family)